MEIDYSAFYPRFTNSSRDQPESVKKVPDAPYNRREDSSSEKEYPVARTSPEKLTQLLQAWSNGDEDAFERLVPLVYDELHRLARRYMRGERPGHTLETTALLHEAYLRLRRSQNVRWQSRSHFLAVASQLMRRVLVDFARARQSQKRGAGSPRRPIDESVDRAEEPAREIVQLDDALRSLASVDARKARVVELRFFGGLTVEETAEAIDLSPETVMRDWKSAKQWLWRELNGGPREA